jgi:hypothetical protein
VQACAPLQLIVNAKTKVIEKCACNWLKYCGIYFLIKKRFSGSIINTFSPFVSNFIARAAPFRFVWR